MSKKRHKNEVALLKAKIEVLKAQKGVLTFQNPTKGDVIQPQIIKEAHLEFTPLIIGDLVKSTVVSLFFIGCCFFLYIFKDRWYSLIRL